MSYFDPNKSNVGLMIVLFFRDGRYTFEYLFIISWCLTTIYKSMHNCIGFIQISTDFGMLNNHLLKNTQLFYKSLHYQDDVDFLEIMISCILTHWGRVTHICVSYLTTIGSDNGM